MASSRRYLFVILIVCTVIFSCISVITGDDEYEPEVGHPYEKGDEDHGHEGHGYEGGFEDGGHGGGGEYGDHDGGGGEDHGHEGGGDEYGDHDGGGEDHDNGEGEEGHDHGGLLCLHEKHIYNSCDESCRLTENGDLHIPYAKVDEFCNGPCLEETHQVLNCLEEMMGNFLFFNQATTRDVRDTIRAGCGHGDHRGDFDVEEHIEEDEGNQLKFPLLFVIVIIVICHILVL